MRADDPDLDVALTTATRHASEIEEQLAQNVTQPDAPVLADRVEHFAEDVHVLAVDAAEQMPG